MKLLYVIACIQVQFQGDKSSVSSQSPSLHIARVYQFPQATPQPAKGKKLNCVVSSKHYSFTESYLGILQDIYSALFLTCTTLDLDSFMDTLVTRKQEREKHRNVNVQHKLMALEVYLTISIKFFCKDFCQIVKVFTQEIGQQIGACLLKNLKNSPHEVSIFWIRKYSICRNIPSRFNLDIIVM